MNLKLKYNYLVTALLPVACRVMEIKANKPDKRKSWCSKEFNSLYETNFNVFGIHI
jgi:hypothetical protein